jgi:phage baseplate assembly protein W
MSIYDQKFIRKNVYKDLDFNFSRLALSNDVGSKSDTNAIKQSVVNLVMTNFGERPFHPEIGSNVNALLFEPSGPITNSYIQDTIKSAIENFEPRIQITSIRVDDTPNNIDQNQIFIRIAFIFLEKNETDSFDIVLERLR